MTVPVKQIYQTKKFNLIFLFKREKKMENGLEFDRILLSTDVSIIKTIKNLGPTINAMQE